MDLWIFDLTGTDMTLNIALLIAVTWLMVQYLLMIWYLVSVQKLLFALQPHNRIINPSLVWLGLIPVFRFVWPFILNPLVCASIRKDMEEKGIDEYGDYGMAMGIVYPALGIVKYFIPFGNFVSIPEFLVWAFYWQKMNEYGRRIREAGNVSEHPDLLDN